MKNGNWSVTDRSGFVISFDEPAWSDPTTPPEEIADSYRRRNPTVEFGNLLVTHWKSGRSTSYPVRKTGPAEPTGPPHR